tara:strand:+ start:293 stop:484 length:192 start_codon:yes stop_codon:yes gene_type:complete
MNQIQIQRALYNARNAYLKAKREMEFYSHEISFLKECEKSLYEPDLFDQLFSDTPLAEEVYGG